MTVFMVILAALIVAIIGLKLTIDKRQWTFNRELDCFEPHPLGPALILFSIFMIAISIWEAAG